MKNIKHIFYSHSWITQLLIEAYIDKQQISYRNTIILSNRNFFQCVDPDLKDRFVKLRKLKFPSWMHAIMAEYKVNQFLKWFEKLLNKNEFILYAHHFHPLEIKVMAQHINCKSVFLIEEGTLSYELEDSVNQRHNHDVLRKRFKNFFWSKKTSDIFNLETLNSSVLKGTLQMFEEAFPYSSNKIVLINDIKGFINNTLPSLLDLKTILVLTPYVDILKFNAETYFTDLERVMVFITENSEDIIYYKFHPNDSELVRLRTNQLAEKFVDRFVLISDSISLEVILLKFKPTVYSFVSSISVYAFLLGCKLNIMTDFIGYMSPNLKINGINLAPYVIESPKQ